MGPSGMTAMVRRCGDLLRDKVGNQKDDDKGGDEDVEVAKLAGHRGQGYRRREKECRK